MYEYGIKFLYFLLFWGSIEPMMMTCPFGQNMYIKVILYRTKREKNAEKQNIAKQKRNQDETLSMTFLEVQSQRKKHPLCWRIAFDFG